MRRILLQTYIGPFVVACLVVLGLRTVLVMMGYLGAEIVIRCVNFVLVRARTDILPAAEGIFGSEFLVARSRLGDTASLLVAAALLARWLYRPADHAIAARTE